MNVIEIESEMKKMSNFERLVVIEIATRLIRGTLDDKQRLSLVEKRRKLKKSAEIMFPEYADDNLWNL